MEKGEERVGGREQRKNHARKMEEREKKPLGLGWCWEGTERGERRTERWRDRQRETTKGSGTEGRRERKAVMEI